ncbi:MAG: hypothetical protein RBR54_04570 [Sulfurimonas sp.]|jgi:hypothetical protein|nr:hypothetical protein [Sulfurimonas sp.]
MTLHLNASESVTQKILSYLESLKKQGESVEIIDGSLYKFEKSGILKGLEQVQNDQICSSEELLEELAR